MSAIRDAAMVLAPARMGEPSRLPWFKASSMISGTFTMAALVEAKKMVPGFTRIYPGVQNCYPAVSQYDRITTICKRFDHLHLLLTSSISIHRAIPVTRNFQAGSGLQIQTKIGTSARTVNFFT
jgi:hypothetical protein